MIDLDQIDEQLESFRRKAILHSEVPPTRRSARHAADDAPNEPPSLRPGHFRRHAATIVEPAPELKAPPEPVREWRMPLEPVPQPAKDRSDSAPSAAPSSRVIEQEALPPPRPIRRKRQVTLDPGMARLVADLVGHGGDSSSITSEITSEPVSSVTDPLPAVQNDTPSAVKPSSAATPKRVWSDRPAIQDSDKASTAVSRPIRIPVEGGSEDAWVARARLELATPVARVVTDTVASEGDEHETELHDLLDHCRERAYRHDDLQWRAALTLLLARTGRLVEARVEHEATSSRFRTVGNPPGSWIDVGRSLSEAESILAGGSGSGPEAASARATRPSLSREAIRQRVRDKAASLQPQTSPVNPKRWTSWEKTG